MLANPTYYLENKGVAGEIVNVPIDIIIQLGAGMKGVSIAEELRIVDPKVVQDIAGKMQRGTKYDIPVLDFTQDFQEGRHRLLAAKQLGQTTAPILLVDKTLSDVRAKISTISVVEEQIPTIQRDISETWDVMGESARTALAEEAGIAQTAVGQKFDELTSVQQDNLRAVHERARVTQPTLPIGEAKADVPVQTRRDVAGFEVMIDEEGNIVICG